MDNIKKIEKILGDIDNCDENIEMLENAMIYFCSNHDICEGYKEAIRLCVIDQYSNHEAEQDPEDFEKLVAILTK
jgi:Na+-transporting NADH:ubiquinone oxidoreductase subunit NqrC